MSAEQIDQARDIISSVSMPVASPARSLTQGGRNIVVSIPDANESTLNAIRRSSQMQFRPVLAIADGVLARP